MPRDNGPLLSIYVRYTLRDKVLAGLEELGRLTGMTNKGKANRSKLFVHMVTEFEETEDYIIVKFPKRGK